MNSEQINDALDRKLLDWNFKIMGLLASLFFRPLALATEPFFRTNFGERYFTGSAAVLAGLLWWLTTKLSGFLGYPLIVTCLQHGWLDTARFLEKMLLSEKVAWVVFIAYAGLATWNCRLIQKRQENGTPWHSMSRGESLFGSEDPWRDLVFSAIAVIVFGIIAPPIGMLFLVSRCASGYLVAKQQASIYARYLDAMDAQIEAEHLETALRDNEPPKATLGIHAPLPKRFAGEHRSNVARAGAGVPVRIAVKRKADAQTPKEQPTPA